MDSTSFAKSRITNSLKTGRALQLVWLSGPKWAIVGMILIVVQGVLPLITLYLTKSIIDSVSEHMSDPHRLHHVFILLWLSAGVALTLALCRSIANLVSVAQSDAVTDYAHSAIHSKSCQIDLEYTRTLNTTTQCIVRWRRRCSGPPG